MTIVVLIAVVWMAGLLGLVALCRAAAQGDRALTAQLSDGWADTHERSLAA